MMGLALPRHAAVIFPQVARIDWRRVAADPGQTIVLVNRLSEATRLCSHGQPAIAVLGIGKGKLAKWLRRRGAKVCRKQDAH
jgi:hypothetical protein